MELYSQILPELLVGACPRGAGDVARLRAEGTVEAALSLQTDVDLERLGLDWETLAERYRAADIRPHRLPIVDFDTADLRRRLPAAVDLLDELLAQHARVFLHCNLGMERSPTVAIAYLAWRRGWPLNQAWELVRHRRACTPQFESLWLAHRGDAQR